MNFSVLYFLDLTEQLKTHYSSRQKCVWELKHEIFWLTAPKQPQDWSFPFTYDLMNELSVCMCVYCVKLFWQIGLTLL